jgi:hypothetical protein
MRGMNFFELLNTSCHTRPRVSLSLVTEMNITSRKIMFLESKDRPVRRADNLAAICKLWNMGSLTSLENLKFGAQSNYNI